MVNKKEIRAAYNQNATKYGSRYVGPKSDYYKELEEQIALDLLGTLDEKMVLDMGTGTARMVHGLLAKGAKRVVGIDISERMIEMSLQNCADPRAFFVVSDCTHNCFRKELFDAITSIGTFEYVSDLAPYLEEAHRLLKENGKFVFTCHNLFGWYPGFKKHWAVFYSIDDLRVILSKCHFAISEVHFTFFFPAILVNAGVRLLPTQKLRRLFISIMVKANKWLQGSYLAKYGSEIIVSVLRI